MDFGIKQLGYFLTLSKELNFGKAARQLGIAHPTRLAGCKQNRHDSRIAQSRNRGEKLGLAPQAANFRA